MKNVEHDDELLGKIKVHGIGKMNIESENNFNIPHLHFITYFSELEQNYTTLCLEFGFHFSDIDYQKSIHGMVRSCLDYLNAKIIHKNDMDKLVEMVAATYFEDLWSLYRQFEFELAKEKKELSSKFLQEIKRKAIEEYANKTFFPDELEYNGAA